MDDDLITALISLVGLVTVGGGIMLGARQIDHHVDVSSCRTFGATSGYETKFVDYNFVSYECQAKTSSGKWIPSKRLRDID